MSITRQAELLGISRSSVYYVPRIDEEDLRALYALDELYTRYPFYGSRRMRFALADNYGLTLGRDHVRRLMRTLGLSAIYPVRRTSIPAPGHRIYPYLLRHNAAAQPNQIWGTDITYIRLTSGFCYLVAILDWFSRYVVSWEVADTLEEAFCLTALRSALSRATPKIHNSDQGSQFTSTAYTGILDAHGIAISMDGRGRCMDNIFTERLWRTVKYEDVYLNQYGTSAEVRDGLAEYFPFYNEERRHQALGYRTPADVYRGQ